MKPNRPRPGLQLKIVAWSFIPAAIILFVVSLFSFFLLQAAMEALMIENNRGTTELMAEQIGRELATPTALLENAARTLDSVDEDNAAVVAALNRSIPNLESFDAGVVVLNRHGMVVASVPARQDSPQENWSDRPYFQEILDAPWTILSDVHPDNPRDALVVSLAVPITTADEGFVGAIVGMYRVDPYGSSVLYRRLEIYRTWPGEGQDLVNAGPTKATFLVDHNGQTVFHTEASLVGSDFSSQGAVQAVLAGRRGPLSTAEYRDKDVITYFAPVPNTRWGLVIEQQRSGVLVFYQRYFQLQVLLFALALIVPAGLAAFGARHITEPIRQLTAASRQIAAGDLRQVINVRTGDELEDLAHQFNRMSVQLRESYAELKEREERFRAVFEGAPIGIHVTSWDGVTTDWSRHRIESNRALQQILGYTEDELARMHLEEYSHHADAVGERALYREMLEGKREHYQIEKRYVAKDGRVFWGRYSASMVRDAGANPHLMIGMVENIDEQKKAEQALQAAYQTLERRVGERTRELAALNSIVAVVSQSLELEEIMDTALAQTMQVCGMDAGAAYELEEHTQTMVLVAHKGLPDNLVQQTGRMPLQVALVGGMPNIDQSKVWQIGQGDIAGELKESILREGIQATFVVPLMAKGKHIGSFVIGSTTPRALTAEEDALLLAVGQQVGMAVENARLYQQAQRIATTAERSRLARELHDSVTQSLYSVVLYAEAAVRSLADKEIPEAGDYLKELRDTAQSALREMRLLIFELRPPALEKNGLVAALRTRLNAVEGRGGMKAQLEVNDDQMAVQLPLVMQEELYHIVQEALNNVIRHAHAQSVQVGIQFAEGTIRLHVSDDGIGFDPANASESSGLGLRGMQERIQRVGGAIQIESEPGKGTQIRVDVPCPRNQVSTGGRK